ncbi:MAG: hypothetical protein MPK62_00445 [Alphaproteobacteria bacterium]|nr:hypothetical protein [Alphaproteobacteria bacterium]MDA8029607.1 hypothetical protein [Alphaproteobacteria bacterium]
MRGTDRFLRVLLMCAGLVTISIASSYLYRWGFISFETDMIIDIAVFAGTAYVVLSYLRRSGVFSKSRPANVMLPSKRRLYMLMGIMAVFAVVPTLALTHPLGVAVSFGTVFGIQYKMYSEAKKGGGPIIKWLMSETAKPSMKSRCLVCQAVYKQGSACPRCGSTKSGVVF